MGCDVGCPYIGRAFDDNWGLPDPTGQSDDVFIEVIERNKTQYYRFRGDSIGRIIILELTERDSSAFEDIIAFLSRHPDLKKWELRDEPILSFPRS